MTGSDSADDSADNLKLVIFCDPINHVIAKHAHVFSIPMATNTQ